MSAPIREAPHGLNLVIETRSGRVIIGRFDSATPFEVLMHDCDVYEPQPGTDPEAYIRETATYGVDVKQRDFSFPAAEVVRWRHLGAIEKLV
jgi:hypothetical protein